jgi:hypothetical protein
MTLATFSSLTTLCYLLLFAVILALHCTVLQEEFDEDRALRLDREAVIVKQLTDHEQEVNERFENQIVRFSFLNPARGIYLV